LTRGVAWHGIGTAFNQGSTFLVNLIVAHLLTREAFGQYAMIQTTLAVVAALAPLSTAYTATKYVAEYRQRDPARASRILGLCAGLSGVMALAACLGLLLGAHTVAASLREPSLAPGLMIASGFLLFSVMNAFLIGALAGLESYPAVGRAGVVSGVLYVLLSAGGALRWGVPGALGGAVVAVFLQSAILWPVLIGEARKWHLRVDLMGAWQESSVFVRFSLPAALNGFVSLPAIWTANALLARQPGGYEQMALFTAANSFRIIVLFIPNIINNVGMSVLNNQRGAGDETRFRRLFWLNWLATGGIVLGAGLFLAATGPWALLLFGRDFRPAYGPLLILLAAALAESIAMATFQIVQSQGHIWWSFFGIVSPAYLTLLVLSYFLAPSAGALGLALAYLGCWLVWLAGVSIAAWRIGVWPSPPVSWQPGPVQEDVR
jgi:O-antigen/teichoic acid export membrane protein